MDTLLTMIAPLPYSAWPKVKEGHMSRDNATSPWRGGVVDVQLKILVLQPALAELSMRHGECQCSPLA